MKTYQYYYIYITTNLVNNKKYIGLHKTNDLFDGYIGSGRIFIRAKKKYKASNFSKIILEFCENEEELKEREVYWVEYYGAYESRNYYNTTKGGESKSGNKLSESTKEIISVKLKDYFKNNPQAVERLRENGSGKKMTKESLEKQLKTRKLKGSNCIKLIVFTKDNTIENYNSIGEAAKIYGQTLLVYMKKDYAFFHNRLFIKLKYYEEYMSEKEAIELITNYKKFKRKS